VVPLLVGVLGERPTPTSWQVSGGGPPLKFYDERECAQRTGGIEMT